MENITEEQLAYYHGEDDAEILRELLLELVNNERTLDDYRHSIILSNTAPI